MGKFLTGLANAIPIVGPAISGAIAAGQERRNVKDTIKHQREMQEYEWSKNLEMWNLQNEYNTPSSQMQRFKDAGLNPNLIYGQGTPGNATTLPKYQAAKPEYRGQPSVAAGALSALGGYQDFVMKNAQIDNVRSQAEINRTEAAWREALLHNRNLKLGSQADQEYMRKKWMYDSTGTVRKQKGYELLDYQADAKKLNLKLMEQDIRNRTSAADLRDLEIEWYQWLKGSGIVGQSLAPIMRILLNSKK